MTGRPLAVLGYHRIGPPPPGGWETWFFVPAETFEAQLRTLREEGWTPIDADLLLAGLEDPERLPERPALVTFDDGYRSLIDHALPVLERQEVPAVSFVPTDHVGGPNAFDPWEPTEAICDWDDLRALERSGVVVESHAASHRSFSELSLHEQTDEARRSKAAIETELGKAARLLAYPFGDPGLVPDVLSGLGYKAAFVYPGEIAKLPVEDRFRIERVAMGPDTDLVGLLQGGVASPGTTR